MKQTIEINVPDGYRAKWNEETQQIDLIKICPKSWEDYSKSTHDEYSVNVPCPRSIASGIDAFIKLHQLHEAWVGNWRGIYTNCSTEKWQIVSDEHTLKVAKHFVETGMLDFPTKEMAEEFLTCFRSLIEKVKKFI